MKKTLVSALTTALVVGAASTTFAAANPFEDVPADHWAYDAVAQLAADGVIEGYGDGTYRGDQEITRYEMAQMVARAMAKSGVSDADKAMIDKLAAEFADELNNLGVRVAALEKKVDNVKWTGKLRYRYINRSLESNNDNEKGSAKTNQYILRLEPKMTINEHWTGKARIDYGNSQSKRDFATAQNLDGDDLTVDRIYAEGKYGNTTIDLGKYPQKTQADYGMILDERIAGAGVTTGNQVKVGLYAGRINLNDHSVFANKTKDNPEQAASLQGIEVYNNRSDKFTWGVGYMHVSNESIFDTKGLSQNYFGDKDANIFNVGLGYKFNDKLGLTAAYAKNTSVDSDAAKLDGRSADDSTFTQSYNFQLDYAGAKANKPGSWGLYAAYRHLGNLATLESTYTENGPVYAGDRGWEFGGSWTLVKNVLWKAAYFTGNQIKNGQGVNTVWTELNLLF